MEIILKDDRVVNLEALMENAEWFDYPSDEPLFCFSYRFAIGTINEVQYEIYESHKCGSHRPARILIRANRITFLEYRILTDYHRESHLSKTFVRPKYPSDDPMIEWTNNGN